MPQVTSLGRTLGGRQVSKSSVRDKSQKDKQEARRTDLIGSCHRTRELAERREQRGNIGRHSVALESLGI